MTETLDNCTIYIPTRGRVNRQKTIHHLPRDLVESGRVVLVASEEESFDLLELGYPVLGKPDWVDGIAQKRQWILDQHDVETDGRYLIMMDDDLRMYERRRDDTGKFLRIDDDEPRQWGMLQELMLALSLTPFAGVANRSGANRYTKRFNLNQRVFDILAMDVPVVRDKFKARFDRVRLMEDFDFALQILSTGTPYLMVNRYCKGDDGSNAIGGCSSYRDSEAQKAASERLAELWPDFVTTEERQSSNWSEGMQTRTDVRVAWKKLYEHGLAERELLSEDPPVELPEHLFYEAWEGED